MHKTLLMLQHFATKNTTACTAFWKAICMAVQVLLKVMHCTKSSYASGCILEYLIHDCSIFPENTAMH